MCASSVCRLVNQSERRRMRNSFHERDRIWWIQWRGRNYLLSCLWSDKTGIHLNIIGRDYERRGKWMCTPTHSWLHTPTGDPFAEIQSFVRASSGCIMDRQEDSTFAGFVEKVPEYLPIDSFDMLIDRQFSFWTDEDELRIRNREIFIYYFSDYLVRHWEVCLSLASFTTIPYHSFCVILPL